MIAAAVAAAAKKNQLFICVSFVKHYSLCFRYAFRFGVCLLKIKNVLAKAYVLNAIAINDVEISNSGCFFSFFFL